MGAGLAVPSTTTFAYGFYIGWHGGCYVGGPCM